MFSVIRHYADGSGRLLCGAREKYKKRLPWTFRPEAVTCERCLRSLAKLKLIGGAK